MLFEQIYDSEHLYFTGSRCSNYIELKKHKQNVTQIDRFKASFKAMAEDICL